MTNRWSHGDLAGVALVVGLFLLPFVLGSALDKFTTHILIQVLLYASMAQAWNIIGGYGGQVSFGHSVFFGIGAYGAALAVVKFQSVPWSGALLGALAAAVVAVMVSYPCFRLKGHYFAIATFAIVEIFSRLFMVWNWVNGALGLDYEVLDDGVWHFVWNSSKTGYYFGALTLFVIVFGVVRWLEAHRFGFYLRAIREGQEVAESLGVDSTRVKLSAMAISAFLTALCGAFFAQYYLRVDPPTVMSLEMSMKFVLIPILGGIGTLWGPFLGAALLLPLQELTRSQLSRLGPGIDLVIFGLLIIIVVVGQPAGILGMVHSLGNWWRRPPKASDEGAADA